LSYQRVREKV